MKSKLTLILSLIFMFTILVGCNKEETIENIEIINLPDKIEIGTFDECNIKLDITYSDNTKELVDVKEKDIHKEYQHYLYEEGTHDFDYLYKGYEVKFKITMYEVKYIVKFINILDEVVKELKVKKNEKVEYPTKEEMYVEGYRFLETYEKEIDYAISDVEIKGNYVKTWVVKFYNGLNEVISTQIVDDKSSAKSPSEEDIKIEGYSFITWDKEYTNIIEDTDIYGVYEEICVHNIINATCTKAAYCTKCNETFGKALGHDLVTETKLATCTQDGQERTYCKREGCTYEETKVLPSGHNYTTKVVNPTCEEQGYTLHTCNNCGDTYKDTYVDALGHKETDWIIDENPTCQKEGTKHTECERCKETIQTASIPTIDHNYVKNKCTMCGKEKEQSQVSLVPYEENGKTYINFGRYPQTVVTDTNLINELDKIITTNSLGYIEYNGEEYKKLVAEPYRLEKSIFKNGDKVEADKTYYFLVEPIKWRVLETVNGGYKLLSEFTLDSQNFYTYGFGTRTINSQTIYPNNYEYSNIRAWLNGYNGISYNVEDYTNKGFIDIAFTEEEQARIKTTLVDNSSESTGDKENQYVCNNTNDKIYLLSYQEATNTSYGFDSDRKIYDSERLVQPTDYALARGCCMLTSTYYYGYGYWYLRSPNFGRNNSARIVCWYGYIDSCDFVTSKSPGVRAALEINLTI